MTDGPESDKEPTLREMLGSEAFRLDVIRQIGGWRGMAESAVPPVVFLILSHWVRPALFTSVGVALAIAGWRLAKKQSPRQALNGLFGIAIAAAFAWRTGKAADFYLPGIILGVVNATVIAVSLVVRWPLVGVVWAFFTGSRDWRSDRKVFRTFAWLTLMWAVVSGAKVGVGAALYVGDFPAWVQGSVRLVLGYPVYIGMIAITLWITGRIHKEDVHPEPEPQAIEGSG